MRRGPWMYKLDERGDPVAVRDVLEWGAAMEEQWADGRNRIAQTEVIPGVVVSTVFLGLDHSHGGMLGDEESPPVLWETMVWDERAPHNERDRDWWDIQRRYTNASAARDGHAEIVEQVKRALGGGKA